MTKRTPTPPQGVTAPTAPHAMRRGGARREVSERVKLESDEGAVFDGWALNVSRGGLRAILEDKVTLGQKFGVTLGADEALRRAARVVWVQEEPDGVIVGLEFTSGSGAQKSVPPDGEGAQPEGDGEEE